MMLYVHSLMRKMIPKNLPKHLGRWKIENCNKKVNEKIDLSNEDHCGPCGQYALKKIESNTNTSNLLKKLDTNKHQTKES